MSSKPLLAFYGATGGSVLAALAPALTTGYECTALARTPSKLTSLLLSKGVPESTLTTNLHITQGDIRDRAACAKPLLHNSRPASIILSGIGAVTLGEATSSSLDLCATAATNILAALRELNLPSKPLFISLSTTGITQGPRDLPILMMPLYRILLARPHEDKKEMERVILEEMRGESAIRGFVLPRMSFLTNGRAVGGVRAGTERSPAVGYKISRDDVGGWVYEQLIVKEGGKWVGEKPTLTY